MINAKYVDGLELRIRELNKKLSDEADAALHLIAENKSLKAERGALLDELQKANAVIIDLQRNPPKYTERHLAEIMAQAVIDAVVSHEVKYGNSQFGRHLREYAANIRQESK